jgi:hypothetical protein
MTDEIETWPGFKKDVNTAAAATPNLMKPVLQPVAKMNGNQKILPVLADFDYMRVTKEKDIAHPEALIKISGASIARAKNLTSISAESKAGKTAVCGVILAGAISKKGDIDGFAELKVLPNPDGKAVIHFDTEQSDDDQQYMVNTILKRAGMDSTPDYFRSYDTLEMSLKDYQPKTNIICELCANQFNGIHLIVIDGGADYILDVNNTDDANNIIAYFRSLSIKYKCPVVVIVHLNPGTEKERGNFGSQIQRACFGLLTIAKDKGNDISTLKLKLGRKAGVEDVHEISFKYNKEKGYHTEVDAADKEIEFDQKYKNLMQKIAGEAFSAVESYNASEAIEKIMANTLKKSTVAKGYLKDMVGFGFMSHTGENKKGLYRVVTSDVGIQSG